ncbi:lactam utilization protein LamB [Bacillus sp. AFS002410]|uniref:5-oxoprolinase subunit PxpA n=1 Tax=Bacillus sp. AFS002410 TaxID=2033481 RepID=UPI000BEF936D|nr:5-oxoprolinase subunit PxpA [Bacillus sp. AFS002410]PEJ59225.1 lactam utilization protein LamB [Bacillus sp. AFS002410]
MIQIDLNCDLGESFGNYKINDEQIMPHITSANIACGLHAGDPFVIYETVKIAKQYNLAIGAHPGFPDLLGFGRREMKFTEDEIYKIVLYQIGALYSVCKVNQIELSHLKPHGALYNMAATNLNLALAITKAMKEFDPSLVLYGLANSKLIEAAVEMNIPFASEVFADRTYTDEGLLVPRNQANSVHHNTRDAIDQALQIVTSKTVTTISGKVIPIQADTICIHSDSDISIKLALELQTVFNDNQIIVKPIGA